MEQEGQPDRHHRLRRGTDQALPGLPHHSRGPEGRTLGRGAISASSTSARGGGIPGIPLKIVLPQARAVLLDSVAKKTAFVQHAVTALGLERTEVVTGRAEALAHQPAYRQTFHLAVCRAVSKLAAIAELTLPFLQTAAWPSSTRRVTSSRS